MSRPRLKALAWTSNGLRMLRCPRRWVRRSAPVSYTCANDRSRYSAGATEQPLATRPARVPMIVVNGLLRIRGRLPMAASTVRLRDMGPDAHGTEIDHRLAETRRATDVCPVQRHGEQRPA